ncbi:hypothetical protein HMPREF1565_2575 [Providencia alcalifaciens RIMD 1656011]|nr:hypothetical protein HMPREF1565_2575 [Providencia alcalifaciens RIMD 1656011]
MNENAADINGNYFLLQERKEEKSKINLYPKVINKLEINYFYDK